MKKRILIFPAGMPRSLSFLEHALAEGQDVVGSSSLGHDPVRDQYPLWVRLPYITDPEFDWALREAIAEFNISRIYTPNPVVWDYLNRFLPGSLPGVTLANSSPIDCEMAPYRKALQLGRAVVAAPLD